MPTLNGSVGKGGHNRADDARLVQQLLNRYRGPSATLLPVDGVVGSQTLLAIEDFQHRVMLMKKPDQLVSPDGPAFKALCGGDTLVFKIAWGSKISPAFKQNGKVRIRRVLHKDQRSLRSIQATVKKRWCNANTKWFRR